MLDVPSETLEQLLGRSREAPGLVATRLRLADAETIVAATSGDLTRSDTLVADTLEPAPGGLFCEALFGELPEPRSGLDDEREERASRLLSPYLRAREDDVLAPRPRTTTFARITLPVAVPHPFASLRPRWRDALRDAGVDPDAWRLHVLPVLPPDLRPIELVEGTRFRTSDLNDLYRQVLIASVRFRRVRELRAPAAIVEVETAALSRAVAQLVENGAPSLGAPREGPGGQPLVGLAAMLESPKRPTWPALAELDGLVARGIVRELAPPLTKRLFGPLAYLRALGIEVDIVAPPPEGSPAVLH